MISKLFFEKDIGRLYNQEALNPIREDIEEATNHSIQHKGHASVDTTSESPADPPAPGSICSPTSHNDTNIVKVQIEPKLLTLLQDCNGPKCHDGSEYSFCTCLQSSTSESSPHQPKTPSAASNSDRSSMDDLATVPPFQLN